MDNEPALEPTIDTIEIRLIASERLIGRIRSEQMRMISELDLQQVATADGCRSMAEWLAGRCDLTASTARRLVATTHRITERPELLAELDDGAASFERVEAVSRTAGTTDDYAHLDIAGVHRAATRQTEITPRHERERFERRHLTLQPTLDHTGGKLWGELPGAEFATVQDALLTVADEFPTESRSDSRATRNADALVAICHGATTTTSGDEETTSVPQSQLTIFINAADKYRNGYIPGGPIVGPNTIDEYFCTSGGVEILGTDGEGKPLNIGRISPKIPPRLRRFVLARDDGCSAAGCTSRHRIQAHHRIHWSDGGPTDANNLVSLCLVAYRPRRYVGRTACRSAT